MDNPFIPKMTQGKSPVWKYFVKKDNDYSICNLCKTEVKE